MLKNDYSDHENAQKVLKRAMQACPNKQKLITASM
jgi:hypothetical protein